VLPVRFYKKQGFFQKVWGQGGCLDPYWMQGQCPTGGEGAKPLNKFGNLQGCTVSQML